MFVRQLAFAAITAAYAGFWIVTFWPSIALAAQTHDYGSLGPLSALLALGAVVALLMPMSGSRRDGRRWLLIALVVVFLAVVAFVQTALVLNTAGPITTTQRAW